MAKTRLRRIAAGLLAAAFLGSATGAFGAVSAGTVRGTVIEPDGKPASGVPLTLRNDITGFRAETRTSATGQYAFFNVPFNPYVLHVETQGFEARHVSIDVRSNAPVEANVTLALAAVTENVEVRGEHSAVVLETDSSQSHIDIDKSFIEHAPAANPSRGMESLIVQTPGFTQDENGRYHFQGAHSEQSYVVDGQPISDQIGITFSNSIDPRILQSAEVIYGNVPAEYGEKIAAVINLTTKSGLGQGAIKGDVHAGTARFKTYDAGVSAGGGTARFGYYLSLDGSKSDRFLDPPNFDNLQNHGDTERVFLRLDTADEGSTNAFRVSGLLGRTKRDVPNTFSQQAANAHNQVETNDWNANLGWQKIFSSSAILDTNVFARNNRYTYYGSPADPSVITNSRRSLDNYGFQPVLTVQTGKANEIKAGALVKLYPIKERFSFGITDPDLNDPNSDGFNPNLAPYDLTRGGSPFLFKDSRTITYFGAFVQDTIRLSDFTAQVGLRYDRASFPLSEAQLEPRVGLAYSLPATKTVFRASYNRIFITPEYENVLFSSSTQASALAPPEVQTSRDLGEGLILVPAARQDVYDVGVQQALGSKVRLDVDFWERRVRFVADQAQFQNTGIVFPVAFARGRLHGWNVRLDLAPVGGLSGYASVGHVHAVYSPPLAGGLFLNTGALDAITGGPFLIDHDQNLQAQAGLNYALGKSGLWFGATARYDSGPVTGADETILQDPDNAFAFPYIRIHSGGGLDPNRAAPRTVWNFSAGADLARYGVPLGVQVDVLNAFDTKGVYNVLSTFGGTHVLPPRTVAGRFRVTF